jgi:hypothetical protein
VSPVRWALVVLLAASTILFAVGVIAERSPATHAEASNGESGEAAAARDEAAESASEADEDERLLGIDLESTPLVVLAVLAGLGLAVLAATRVGRASGFLLAVAVIALVWAVLDIREVAHQLDESRTGIALVAIAVAVLHLATAVISGRLGRERPSGA